MTNKKHRSYKKSENIHKYIIWVILILISIISIYPIWYIFLGAFSDPSKVSNNGVPYLIPNGFSSKAFKNHINLEILNAMGNTFFITIVGAGLSITLTILCAFVLSQKKVPGIRILTIFVMLTIWLKPGMISIYQNIQALNLKNSMLGIILPFSFSAFNVILLRTSFMAIPDDMIESAEIDGANKFQILFKIMIPNSISAITTISLFHIIDRWNGYFWSELILDQERYPMQVFVKKLLNSGSGELGEAVSAAEIMSSSYSLILITVLPILFIFPFIQKSFKKGIMSGAIK